MSSTETNAANGIADLEKGRGAQTGNHDGSHNDEHKKGKGHVRTGDKTGEEIVIPKNRLVVVFIGLMLTVFLAALDQTIVCTPHPLYDKTNRAATALPTIVRDLGGGENYAWVGTSYLLASASFTPLYGRCRSTPWRGTLTTVNCSDASRCCTPRSSFSSLARRCAVPPRVCSP